MSIEMKIVVTGQHLKELQKKYGKFYVDIYARDGYSGTMVCCEDEADYDKMANDQEYFEQRIIETTTNF